MSRAPRAVMFAVSIVAACAASPPQPAALVPQVAAPVPPPVAAPTLDGYWSGVLAGQLHLALHVKGDAGMLDSIDQGATLEIDHVALNGAAVHFEVPRVHGTYDGTLAGDHVDGTWKQDGVPAQPLAFTRGTPPPETAHAKLPPPPLDAPIDVVVPKPPTVLRADGRSHLVYELHVTNFSHAPIELTRIDALAGERSLATFSDAALVDMTILPGTSQTDRHVTFGAGQVAVVFMWVTFDGPTPAKVDHKIAVKLGDNELTVAGPTLAIANAPPRVIAPPLKGANWVAANGPSNKSAHRRALIPVGGRARIGQRFAIDWVKFGDDGNTFTGDETKNASYHAYGEHALAVAAGTVVEIKDGIVENVPQKPPVVPITLDSVAGNHVVVDLGNGAFAMWAHLQPGSLKVKVGDRVKAGQELGLVGNSGNSSEPHLWSNAPRPAPCASSSVPSMSNRYRITDGRSAPAASCGSRPPTSRRH